MTEPLHWNDWTTLHLVQLGYEADAAPRGVRLAHPSASVDDAVRVVIAGIEVEGRISAIEGATLRVALVAGVAARSRWRRHRCPRRGARDAAPLARGRKELRTDAGPHAR